MSRPGSTPGPAGSSRLCALDNLVKGASGQAIQCANVALGLPETTGLPLRGALPVSVAVPTGFVAAGGSAGIKANGALDVAVVTTADGRAVPAAGVFTANLRRGRAGPGEPGPPGRQRRPRRRGDPHLGQRQRRHRPARS